MKIRLFKWQRERHIHSKTIQLIGNMEMKLKQFKILKNHKRMQLQSYLKIILMDTIHK